MDHVADIRAFNRFYTRIIGVLDEHINSSPFTLAEARLIYELAQRGFASGTDLAGNLGIDPAYLSRMVKRLVAADLVVVTPNLADRRSNNLALSSDGDAAFRMLDEGSQTGVEALIEPLSQSERDDLLAAMKRIRTLLGETGRNAPLVLRPHKIGELGWLIHRQGLLYNQQFGWNGEFEALIAGLYRDFEQAPPSPPKGLWIAERDGRVLGSVFVMATANLPGSAQLRMLYVEPEARGQGIGRTLVEQAITFARDNGYERIRLWTQSILVPARKIYAGTGFVHVDTAEHHSFGKDLVGETWELTFQA